MNNLNKIIVLQLSDDKNPLSAICQNLLKGGQLIMTNEIDVSGKEIRDLFGKNLRRLRMKAGLSQLALAGESDLAHTFINDLENGKKWISCKTMAHFCQVFHVEPNQFFFPVTKAEQEHSEILSTYIDDFSESVMKSVADFKNRYL